MRCTPNPMDPAVTARHAIDLLRQNESFSNVAIEKSINVKAISIVRAVIASSHLLAKAPIARPLESINEPGNAKGVKLNQLSRWARGIE